MTVIHKPYTTFGCAKSTFRSLALYMLAHVVTSCVTVQCHVLHTAHVHVHTSIGTTSPNVKEDTVISGMSCMSMPPKP